MMHTHTGQRRDGLLPALHSAVAVRGAAVPVAAHGVQQLGVRPDHPPRRTLAHAARSRGCLPRQLAVSSIPFPCWSNPGSPSAPCHWRAGSWPARRPPATRTRRRGCGSSPGRYREALSVLPVLTPVCVSCTDAARRRAARPREPVAAAFGRWRGSSSSSWRRARRVQGRHGRWPRGQEPPRP